jgi:hypothetical protein
MEGCKKRQPDKGKPWIVQFFQKDLKQGGVSLGQGQSIKFAG